MCEEGILLEVVFNRSRAPSATSAECPLAAISRAETPATKGVAIDVPERMAKLPRVVGKVETIPPPGAATAGLKWKSFEGASTIVRCQHIVSNFAPTVVLCQELPLSRPKFDPFVPNQSVKVGNR